MTDNVKLLSIEDARIVAEIYYEEPGGDLWCLIQNFDSVKLIDGLGTPNPTYRYWDLETSNTLEIAYALLDSRINGESEKLIAILSNEFEVDVCDWHEDFLTKDGATAELEALYRNASHRADTLFGIADAHREAEVRNYLKRKARIWWRYADAAQRNLRRARELAKEKQTAGV